MLALFLLSFPWPSGEGDGALASRIAPPPGYHRIAAEEGSFAAWLRSLPLKPGTPKVMLYDGTPKRNQAAHVAVFDIDVGGEDLQQCADAVMRLRAEYLWSRQLPVQFTFTNGDVASWSRWRSGERPLVRANKVSWTRSAPADASYAAFRAYLDIVFTYAGTASLEKTLDPVADVGAVRAGDVFIQGGHPGHAVIVVDVVENDDHEKLFMVAQSYMPAQDIQLLANGNNPKLSPWYRATGKGALLTPEWSFRDGALRRFR